MTGTLEMSAHQAAVLDAVLGGLPDEPAVSAQELTQLRVRLNGALRSLVEARPDVGEMHLDRYSLPAALRGPPRTERDDFEWNAPFAARSLGLPAVARLSKGRLRGLGAAVADSMDEVLSGTGRLGVWLAGLDSTERAVVAAQARSWAARAWIAVPWSSFDRVQFCVGSIWYRPLGPRTPVVLRARPEAMVRVRGTRALEGVLVTLGRPDPLVAGFHALVVALDRRRAPLRTVVVEASSGRIDASDLDLGLLERAVEDVVEAVGQMTRQGQS